MAEVVFLLCALTSFACAGLLGRAYLRKRLRLLAWSCLCFIGLALNNIFLFFDMIIVPGTDLSMVRGFAALFGVSALIYGLIWDAV